MDDFFTLAGLATFGGATLAVVVVTSGVRHIFNWGGRKFAFFVSLALAALGFLVSQSTPPPGDPTTQGASLTSLLLALVLIVVNGFLLYCTAFGLQNSTIPPGGGGPDETVQLLSRKLTFRTPW